MAIARHGKVTIDNFDTSVYIRYAQYKQMLENIQNYYHLEEADSIPPQTHVEATAAAYSRIDMLMGAIAMYTPWALFEPPKAFRDMRRSPFSFSRIAPLLGSEEKQESYLAKLDSVVCETEDEEEEREVLLNFLELLEKLNDMLQFIIGRVGQFRQG